MKNKQILMGIPAIVLVFGLAFIGCKQPTDDDGGNVNTEPKTVKITNITGISGRIRIMVAKNKVTQFDSEHSPENIAIGSNTIQGGLLEVSLMVPEQNFYETETPWTGNGKYYIYFSPTDISGNVRAYTGNGTEPIQVDFNEAIKSLEFTGFTLFGHP
jgi:hypothetical protein